MKLPDVFNRFFRETPVREDVYLSLVFEALLVEAAVWTLSRTKNPHISETTLELVETHSWEKRLEACDRAIARLAQKAGRDDFEKVVLGLPVSMLTPQDDIEHTVRSAIKTLTEELELTPIGFIPIHQAIIHGIRQEEGVPPSVILLEVGEQESTMILYKVGIETGRVNIQSDDLVPGLERALKGFKELEVLPSRILLYGTRQEELEGYSRDLLKHPWPTRANFLHYPKIEVFPALMLAQAVSLAGASELASHVVGDDTTQTMKSTNTMPPMQADAHENIIDETIPVEGAASEEDIKNEGTPLAMQEDEDDDVLATKDTDGAQDLSDEQDKGNGADENFVEVTPESLGFEPNRDILEHPVVHKLQESPETVEREKIDESKNIRKGEAIKEFIMRFVPVLKLPKFQVPTASKTGLVIMLIIALLGLGGGWLTYWVLPHVTITLYQVMKVIPESSTVTVNPTATVVDAGNKIIPGRKQEKIVSGEKTVSVTGQKDFGDPARGTVTVYNKSLTQKQVKKGTVLAAGSLTFTLDSDVAIASASESLASGSVTYGKASAPITAVKLGPQSNIPANTEFSIKDTAPSVLVARNDAAFTGGTSKVVSVVSRADYDALITELTKELIAKAKEELAGGVSGGERLIDETVKTSVTAKKFDAELDQEASQLQGTITVAITGISYSNEDVASLFSDLVAAKVPSGYTLQNSDARILATNVKIQKDGSIGLSIQYQGQAIPTFDVPMIQKKLAGKTLLQAQEILKATNGVGGLEMNTVTGSVWGQKLPAKADNITITVAVLE